jgi:Protein of unknown function (DUF2281)
MGKLQKIPILQKIREQNIMLTATKGTYENGKITLEESLDFIDKVNVIVTFLEVIPSQKKKRVAGSLKGKVWYADDFDAPLEDLKDYM